MDEPRRGIITGSMFLEFQEDAKGPYLLREKRLEKAQYMCIVWFSPDRYGFDNYIMIFRKIPEKIIEVAEWSGQAGIPVVKDMLDKLFDYYSGRCSNILLGVGRNRSGKQFIDELKRDREHSYNLYRSMIKNTATGVINPEEGICCDDEDKIGLLDRLKYVVTTKIDSFPHDVENIRVVGDEHSIPKKDEAFIMALAGAYRMFREHPYKKPIDESAKRAFAAEMKRPLFRFGP